MGTELADEKPIIITRNISGCLADAANYGITDWAKEGLYGYVIGFDPAMSSLGFSILYWNAANKGLDETPAEGVIGCKADLDAKIGEAFYSALRGCGTEDDPSAVQMALAMEKRLRADLRPFAALLHESPAYGIIRKTVETIMSGAPIEAAGPEGDLAFGYWCGDDPDVEMRCGCGAVHGKGLAGRLTVHRTSAKISRANPEKSQHDLLTALNKAGIPASLTSEGSVAYVDEKGMSECSLDCEAYLILPGSFCTSSYNSGSIAHEDIDFFGPIINKYVKVDAIGQFGIHEEARLIGKDVADDYLRAMGRVEKFWKAIQDAALEALSPASHYLEERKGWLRLNALAIFREDLENATPLVRKALAGQGILGDDLEPGMNVAYAYTTPGAGIVMELGRIRSVRRSDLDDSLIFDTDKIQYRLDLDLGLRITYALEKSGSNGYGGMIDEEDCHETAYEYLDKGAFFSWEGTLHGRMFSPIDAIKEQARGEAAVQVMQEGDRFLCTYYSPIRDGPQGRFSLPGFFSLSDDDLRQIAEVVRKAIARHDSL